MKLPSIRGRYTSNADLSKTNWFQVGGKAEVLFKPADIEDLQHFLQNKPDCRITILGVGSNVIIRDGGIDGVVIKLGRGFTETKYTPIGDNKPIGGIVAAGAAVLDVNLSQYCANEGLEGVEFMSGIPGGVGGAIAMNAGAYGKEIIDVVEKVEMIDYSGKIKEFSCEEMQFKYRRCMKLYEKDYIVTKAWFKVEKGNRIEILDRIEQIKLEREATQPVRSRTGGSTFQNPENGKAWELIDGAGLRGFKIGWAQVSEQHCNFLINTGNAKAKDIEALIKHIQREVKRSSKVMLKPEIKIIGNP